MNADSSPALLSESVASLDSQARDHWKMTGELPDKAPPAERTPKEDSSPSEPDAPAVEIAAKTPADSEPAPSSKKRGNAATRNAELDTEIKDLQDKLKLRAQLREELGRTAPVTPSSAGDKKADSPPATEGRPPAELLTRPDVTKPPMDEAEFFTAYPNATLGQFTRYQSRYDQLEYQANQSRTATLETGRQKYLGHYTKAEESDPEIRAKLPQAFIDANPVIRQGSGPLDFVAREIQDSERGAEMLQHLADHPKEFDRLSALPDAAAVIREMARLEARVSPSTSTPPTPTKGISSAPAPTTSLGRRNAAPADASLAAVSDGDVRRYMDEQNRKDLARRGTR